MKMSMQASEVVRKGRDIEQESHKRVCARASESEASENGIEREERRR